MERDQLQRAAVGAVVVGTLAAVATGRLPRWLRILVVAAAVVLTGAVGLFGYRALTTPKTLTVATGSIDGDMTRVMSAVAARIAANKAPVRLKVVEKGTAIEASKAFSAGEVDLAVGRGDIGDLTAGRAVVVIANSVVLIITPPGSKVEDIGDLKGKTVGVVGGAANHPLVEALKKEYELDRLKVNFRDLAPMEVPSALAGRQIAALLLVMPLTDKYLTMLRNLFPAGKQKPGLVAIDSAGAIAAVSRAYESWDLPKGTLRGSPPIPDDDLTTLRVPILLLAKKTLDDDTVAALTKSIMDARRDLAGEFPVLAQIAAPSTDKDAFVPIHPGAAAFFDGDTKTFFDKYGDQIFYGSMLLGSLTSLFAGAWKFMAKDTAPEERTMARLRLLSEQVVAADDEPTLAALERQVDGVLGSELDKIADRNPDAAEPAALTLAIHRLERLIARRRAELAAGTAPMPPGPETQHA